MTETTTAETTTAEMTKSAPTARKVPEVPIAQFGKDHYSALAYLETRVVDKGAGAGPEPNLNHDMYSKVRGIGEIRHDRFRCNQKRHPLLDQSIHDRNWQDSYSTRLKVGQVIGHDDWDVLDDFDAVGWVEILSTVNGIFVLTEEGLRVAGLLRAHKAQGGNFAGFEYTPPPPSRAATR